MPMYGSCLSYEGINQRLFRKGCIIQRARERGDGHVKNKNMTGTSCELIRNRRRLRKACKKNKKLLFHCGVPEEKIS